MKNDNIKWCYHFPLYIFCVIIYIIIFRVLSFMMLSFFTVSKCYHFMLSFSLVHILCYHLCYHLMLSFIVIISPLFSFSWKRDTLIINAPLWGNDSVTALSSNRMWTVWMINTARVELVQLEPSWVGTNRFDSRWVKKRTLLLSVALKVHKIEIFFGFDFEICIISWLVTLKY